MGNLRIHLVGLALVGAVSLEAQVPTIVKEIGELEGVRDPKCYASASRLEDFIYGTPLEAGARYEKIALQKKLIRDAWVKATAAATDAGKPRIDVDTLRPILQAAVPYVQTADGNWIVRPDDASKTLITARNKRQYGSVAYALRAILAVQQDALVDGTKLLPLDDAAVELFKESVDIVSLAALQSADRQTRTDNRERINAATLDAAWKNVVRTAEIKPAPVHRAQAASGEKFATIKAIVAEKLAAFEKYNSLSAQVFNRNIQVYMARHMWPEDPAEAETFKKQFTETMIAWTADVMLDAEGRAKKAGHPFIRVEDVDAAVQHYEPHELNRYEDCIYFPRLPHDERITIEAYD